MRSLHVQPNTYADNALEALNTLVKWAMIIMLIFSLGYLYCEGNRKLDITRYDDAYNAGFKQGQDDCYGLPCTQYMIIVGQAAKEARQKPVKVKRQQVASVWSAVK